MSNRREIIVNMVDSSVNATNAANTITTAINEKHESFELVNSNGQAIASVISAFPFLRPVMLQANTFAATAVFLKIVIDVKNEGINGVNAGDVLSLVANVSGIVATGAILAGTAPGWAAGATFVAIGAGIASLMVSANAIGKLHAWSTGIFDTWAPTSPVPITTADLYMDTNGWFREHADIVEDPEAGFGGIIIEHSNWEAADAHFYRDPPPPPGEDDIEIDNPQFIIINS